MIGDSEEQNRTAVVMFADLCGSTSLYESLGDAAAQELVETALTYADTAIREESGRVIKHIGDEILAVFEDLDSAINAACRIHKLQNADSKMSRLRFKIGIRSGMVVERNQDIFGDTVNTAARIVALAGPGQTLCGEEVCNVFIPNVGTRSIGHHPLKGKSSPVALFEVLTGDSPGLTKQATVAAGRRGRKQRVLKVVSDSQTVEIAPGRIITIGREDNADIRIDHELVSRQHASIEGIRDRFVLRDSSTNGLRIRTADGHSYMVHRDQFTLIGRGRIAFGNTDEIDRTPFLTYEVLDIAR